jgi:hypothetical protein
MRSTMATALGAGLFVAALSACGGNATGVATKDDGVPPSSGSDQGNGSTALNGGGNDNPTNAGSTGINGGGSTSGAPQTCGATEPCPTGEICSAQGDRGALGYCIETCTLPEGVGSGKSSCPGDEICIRGEQGGLGACEIPCAKDTDCAPIAGFDASCVSVDPTGPHFCVWQPPATPGGI